MKTLGLKKKLFLAITALSIIFFALSIFIETTFQYPTKRCSGLLMDINHSPILKCDVHINGRQVSIISLSSDTSTKKTSPQKQSSFGGQGTSFNQGSRIARYIGQSQGVITLSPPALRFALAETLLGNKQPLQDSQARLEQTKTDLQNITPPPEAQVFHALSIELINEYATIVTKVLDTPSKDLRSSTIANLLAKTKKTATQARREFQFLTGQFDLPYTTPLVILLYDEALGR